jgi:RHS repeat-associated protein
VWRWDQQEPFGNTVPDENPSGLGVFDLPLRLPGQYFDRETALHYNYFRDYDPSLGTYKESDPIGLRASLNVYGYVNANPLSTLDYFGLVGPGFVLPVVVRPIQVVMATLGVPINILGTQAAVALFGPPTPVNAMIAASINAVSLASAVQVAGAASAAGGRCYGDGSYVSCNIYCRLSAWPIGKQRRVCANRLYSC